MLALGQCYTGRVAQDWQDRLFGKEVGAIQTSAEAICRAEGLPGRRRQQVFLPWQS